MLELNAEPRTVTGKKAGRLRREGLIPGVLYGTGIDPLKLTFEKKILERVLQAAGTSSLVIVKVGKNLHTAIVRDTQRDSIRHDIQHVDLMQVAMDETMTTEVSLVLVGELPPAAILIQELNSVEIECLPGALPANLTVDISHLENPGDTLTVVDLQVPEGVTILTDTEQLVALLASPAAERVEEEIEEETEVFGLEPLGEEQEPPRW